MRSLTGIIYNSFVDRIKFKISEIWKEKIIRKKKQEIWVRERKGYGS